jgi:hypothetical protein
MRIFRHRAGQALARLRKEEPASRSSGDGNAGLPSLLNSLSFGSNAISFWSAANTAVVRSSRERKRSGGGLSRAGRAAEYRASSRRGICVYRQSELKRGAEGRVRRGPQPAIVRFDDGAADREAHTHAARFSGEEGVEKPVRILGGDPDAAIRHS